MRSNEEEALSLYAVIVETLLKNPKVSQSQNKGFGSSALWANGRIFMTLSRKGDLVAKLPKERVKQLVELGEEKQWDPRGNGRLMKEWVVIKTKNNARLLSIAKEALEFANVKHPARPARF